MPASTQSPDASDVTRGVVKLLIEVLGRGPTKASAYLQRDVVTVVLAETLTQPELRLIRLGQAGAVIAVRQAMHDTMRAPLAKFVGEATHRHVRSVHLDHDLEADVLTIVCTLSEA